MLWIPKAYCYPMPPFPEPQSSVRMGRHSAEDTHLTLSIYCEINQFLELPLSASVYLLGCHSWETCVQQSCSQWTLWEAWRVATFAGYICLQPLGGARELFPEPACDLLEFAIVD